MNRTTSIVTVLVAFTLPLATGCGGKDTADKKKTSTTTAGDKTKPASAAPAATTFRNGLDDEDRQGFYHMAEGSEVFPLDWLKALVNDKTGELFLSSVDRYGLLPDDANEFQLPVGLTAEESRDLRFVGKMVGINCAACHVGEVTYKGRGMRIDGATNLFDARKYFTELADSTTATIKDPVQLIAFVSRVREVREQQAGEDPSRVRQDIRELIKHVAEKESEIKGPIGDRVKEMLAADEDRDAPKVADGVSQRNKSADEWRTELLEGFQPPNVEGLLEGARKDLIRITGRDEAEARGSLVGTLEEIYINLRLLKARKEFLKRLARLGQSTINDGGFGRVDAFGTARYLLFDPDYAPNSPVSYPHLWGFNDIAWLHYDSNTTSVIERNVGQALGLGAVVDDETKESTVKPDNLNKLEQLARKITPPVWPDELFGAVDKTKFDRGQQVFADNCLGCHPHKAPSPADQEKLNFDLDEIGTDRVRAETFAEKLPDGTDYYKSLGDALGVITDKAYANIGVSPEERKELEKARPPEFRAIKKYAGRPLVAIWASAPYLHNGSVPTMWDLLQPADKRPKKFPVGHREYDPVKLGYATDVKEPKTTFDTSKPGNQNIGHEGPKYGTDLRDDDKWALIEYLKGPIKQP